MKAILSLLLLFFVGCSKMELVRMKKQTDADAIRIVNRYRQAGTGEVEVVMKDYLALADDYERKGWARYGAPGWIDELRSVCEGRLAVYSKAIGNDEAYKTHVHRAINLRNRVNPTVAHTEEDICGFVVRLDELHIQPRWRKELSQPLTSSRPSFYDSNNTAEYYGRCPKCQRWVKGYITSEDYGDASGKLVGGTTHITGMCKDCRLHLQEDKPSRLTNDSRIVTWILR